MHELYVVYASTPVTIAPTPAMNLPNVPAVLPIPAPVSLRPALPNARLTVSPGTWIAGYLQRRNPRRPRCGHQAGRRSIDLVLRHYRPARAPARSPNGATDHPCPLAYRKHRLQSMDPVLESRARLSTRTECSAGRPASLDAGFQSTSVFRLSKTASSPPTKGSDRHHSTHRRGHASRDSHSPPPIPWATLLLNTS